jgi:hypothetical protein
MDTPDGEHLAVIDDILSEGLAIMAGTYSLTSAGITLANQAVTLVFLNPAAAPALDLGFRRFWVGQSNNMASAQQRVQLNTQVTAFPTLVSATPTKLAVADSASIITGGTAGAAGTCGINASGEGAGAKTIIWADTFNVVNGWLLVLTPEEQIEQASGATSGLGLHLPAAPGTLSNWAFGCTWIEG